MSKPESSWPPVKDNTRALPTKEHVCAVIVTYHPDLDFSGRLMRIASAVKQVVIVDNHSNSTALQMIQSLLEKLDFSLIHNEENRGIAAALNQGIEEGKRQGYPWVLLFDQDTLIFDSMLSSMLAAYQQHPMKERLAIIGSNYVNKTGQAVFSFKSDTASLFEEQKAVITSGSLLSVRAFEHIGPFKEDYFIDLVDHEYCLRARAKGFHVISTRKPVMCHAIGNQSTYRILGRSVETSSHPPFRLYYMTRNRIDCIRRYFFREPRWCLKELEILVKKIIVIILWEEMKLAKLKNMCIGLCHGLRGKLGKYEHAD